MKIALIGGGGREHALCWKLAQSPKVSEIYAFTDNPGIKKLAKTVDLNPENFAELAQFLLEENINYVVVGPEDLLVKGIVDFLEEKGIKVFGPNKAASQLEGSKAFSKEVMVKNNVETAFYREFSESNAALNYVHSLNQYPVVIKADGLCAGKGVAIVHSFKEAEDYIKEVLDKNLFGEAGSKIIIEEFLDGEEVSIFAITDGKTVKYLSPAQDHKKIYENDEGPNTGGMGTYAPTELGSKDFINYVDKNVVKPVLEGLKAEGIIYKGVLYAGLILDKNGPKVLEFNCRFGDPETQVLMPLLRTDLADIVEAVCNETLDELDIELSNDKAVCFVAASGGYPQSYKKGEEIHGLEKLNTLYFIAGAKESNGKILTNGGRVLNIIGIGQSIEKAREKALFEIEKVSFKGMQYRKDIAVKELKRPKVAVIMGSDSDLPVVKEGLKILEEMEIAFKVYILSAHRSPNEAAKVAESWDFKGFKAVIAAAGMAAHLPGVMAAHTDLPVIGIPIEAKFQGLDALYSIVQMPGGVPVATVSTGKAGAKNAAVLALEILALSDDKYKEKLKLYKQHQKTAVLEKNRLIDEIGYQEYLERKSVK